MPGLNPSFPRLYTEDIPLAPYIRLHSTGQGLDWPPRVTKGLFMYFTFPLPLLRLPPLPPLHPSDRLAPTRVNSPRTLLHPRIRYRCHSGREVLVEGSSLAFFLLHCQPPPPSS